MDIQSTINQAANWLFSDVTNVACVIGVLAVIGAINGVRASLTHCGRSYKCGRKVL